MPSTGVNLTCTMPIIKDIIAQHMLQLNTRTCNQINIPKQEGHVMGLQAPDPSHIVCNKFQCMSHEMVHMSHGKQLCKSICNKFQCMSHDVVHVSWQTIMQHHV